MTLRHLQIFWAVCEKMNISRAAETLNMSQPAVSLAIKELEAFYNTKLFDRIGRRIYLNEAGEKLRTYTYGILDEFAQSISDIRDAHGFISCTIGANATIGECYLSDIVKQLKAAMPALHIVAEIENNRAIEYKLRENKLDFALIDSVVDSPALSAALLFQENMVAVCAPGLMESRKMDIHALAAQPLLLREKGSGCRSCVEAVFSAAGAIPKINAESVSSHVLLSLAASGMGISILPQKLAQPALDSGALTVLHIKNTAFIRTYYLVYLSQKYLTPAVKTCIELVYNYFRNLEL